MQPNHGTTANSSLKVARGTYLIEPHFAKGGRSLRGSHSELKDESISGDGDGAISRAGWRWLVLGGPVVCLVSKMEVMEAMGPSKKWSL